MIRVRGPVQPFWTLFLQATSPTEGRQGATEGAPSLDGMRTKNPLKIASPEAWTN